MAAAVNTNIGDEVFFNATTYGTNLWSGEVSTGLSPNLWSILWMCDHEHLAEYFQLR